MSITVSQFITYCTMTDDIRRWRKHRQWSLVNSGRRQTTTIVKLMISSYITLVVPNGKNCERLKINWMQTQPFLQKTTETYCEKK